MITSCPLPEPMTVDALRLRRALNAAQLGSWQYDPARRGLSWDMRSKEILGTDENETTVEEFMTWVHPHDAERVSVAYHTVLDPAEPKRTATEFRLRRANGEVRWVRSLGLAYFDFEGDRREQVTVSVVGTVADITERKEHEEMEHLFMRAVSHRAKNLLTVVNAIAHQTIAKDPDDFLNRFSVRIAALSSNQDLLSRNDWRGVDVEDLVNAQLAHFVSLIGSRIAVHGPRLMLRPESAQAIGFALHELATNASKYGALSTDAGRVDVCWESDGQTFTICWTEREGPPVLPPERHGFGTMVMGPMVERSVGGRVVLDYPLSGAAWRLTCPTAKALERRPRTATPAPPSP